MWAPESLGKTVIASAAPYHRLSAITWRQKLENGPRVVVEPANEPVVDLSVQAEQLEAVTASRYWRCRWSFSMSRRARAFFESFSSCTACW
jgi:hypothetical protein